MYMCVCVCVCNVSWHWEKAFRSRHVSGLSLFGVWSVSLHLWMSVFIPVASAARTVGPHVQWSQAQAGHTVSPPTLWPPGLPQSSPPIPLVGAPVHTWVHTSLPQQALQSSWPRSPDTHSKLDRLDTQVPEQMHTGLHGSCPTLQKVREVGLPSPPSLPRIWCPFGWWDLRGDV